MGMQGVQVVAPGRAEFIKMPRPEPLPGHVIVRADRLALCGSDIHMLHYSDPSNYPFPPGTTGHELVGYVTDIDTADPEIAVGDRVLALAPGHLAMCEYFLAQREHVVPLPPGLPMEVLLQGQQLGTVLFASQRLPSLIGKTVVIVGQGSAGLWFSFHLRRAGARRVIALDIEPYRLEWSKRFGATTTICNAGGDAEQQVIAANDGELADVVIEAAGEIDAINLAPRLVRKFGTILYFGVPRGQTIPFDFQTLFQKCCQATTIVGASVETNQTSTRVALDLIAQGIAPAAELITHRIPFAGVIDAYEMHHRREDRAVKIVIEMPS